MFPCLNNRLFHLKAIIRGASCNDMYQKLVPSFTRVLNEEERSLILLKSKAICGHSQFHIKIVIATHFL